MDVKLKALNYYWDENRDVINLNLIDMHDNHSFFLDSFKVYVHGFFFCHLTRIVNVSPSDSIYLNNSNVKVASIAQKMHDVSLTLRTCNNIKEQEQLIFHIC